MSRSNEEKGWKHYFRTTPYIRVIELAKTPGWDEFSKNAILVTGSVLLVGLIGFLIFRVMDFIPM